MPNRTTADEEFDADLVGMLAAPHAVPLGLKPDVPWFDFDLVIELGLGYVNRGESAAAEAVATAALASRSAKVQAAGQLVTALLQLSRGRYRRAWARAGKAAKVTDPDVAAEVAFARGLILEGRGNNRDASHQYALVAESGRYRSIGRGALAFGEMLLRETEGWDQDAYDVLGAAVDSGFPEAVGSALLAQATLADRSGDMDMAEFLYREATGASVPRAAAQAAFHLGDILRERGDLAGAREQFRAASRSSDPEFSAKGALNLGVLLMEAGEAAEAIELFGFAAASSYEPAAARGHGHLGLLSIDAGDPRTAEHHLRIALRCKDPQLQAGARKGLDHIRNSGR
ncbi:tetratricopeptide repeat protein [Kitasatospora acidiphila]|uniref:Tetratricopeptide repeat protein n=1 Tax=Kitasatospora acidiphila TaxID=2567942 RepID=A0A540VZL3_9ACTN|nr:tetratricopeptide repeat protein [Kitasatospora acidiphila]TQF02212.1 tetratricopeptide repeat protein [Kitasatospora acidiphila]